MIDPELLKYLPKFSNDGEVQDFYSSMEEIRRTGALASKNFYSTYGTKRQPYLDQGDCMSETPIFKLPDTKSVLGKGFILSNVCDISPDNTRPTSARILYAPVLSLEKYIAKLKEDGHYSENRVKSIKAQETTNLFFIPAGQGLSYDAIVPLDHIGSLPGDFYSQNEIREKRLFQLSRIGWYTLLMKLTHHLARSNDELFSNRSPISNP